MADNQIAVEFSSDAQKLLRDMAAQDAKLRALEQELKRVKDGYVETGKAGEQAMSRTEKATGPAAKAVWEEDRAIRATKKSWEEQAKAAEGAQNTQKNLADDFLGKVGGIVAGYVSIRTAVTLLKDELQNVIDLQARAAAAQLDTSSSRKDIIRNMPGASDTSVKRALAASQEISRASGVEERYINQAVAQGLSASGGNLEAVIPAVKAAAEFLPDKPQDLPLYAGAMLDLSKVTNTQDSAINRGLLSFVGGMSRVVDPKMQAEHIPKALIGVQNYGASASESTALFSALSMAAADPMGRQSGTGAVRLAEQLRAFLPEGGRAAEMGGPGLSDVEIQQREALHANKQYKEAVRRQASGGRLSEEHLRLLKREEVMAAKEARGSETMPAIPGMSTFGERLQFMWDNPAIAKKFIAESSFEAKVGGPIEQLLMDPRGSTIGAEYRKNLAMMPGATGFGRAVAGAGLPAELQGVAGAGADAVARNAALAAMGNRQVEQFGLDPLSAQGKLKRAYNQTEEEMLLGNVLGAQGSINREGLKKVLLASGEAALATKIDSLQFEAGSGLGTTGGIDQVIGLLSARKTGLLNPMEIGGYSAGMGFAAGNYASRQPSQTERETAASLARLIEVMQGVRDEIRAQGQRNRPPALAKPDEDK